MVCVRNSLSSSILSPKKCGKFNPKWVGRIWLRILFVSTLIEKLTDSTGELISIIEVGSTKERFIKFSVNVVSWPNKKLEYKKNEKNNNLTKSN